MKDAFRGTFFEKKASPNPSKKLSKKGNGSECLFRKTSLVGREAAVQVRGIGVLLEKAFSDPSGSFKKRKAEYRRANIFCCLYGFPFLKVFGRGLGKPFFQKGFPKASPHHGVGVVPGVTVEPREAIIL